MAAQSQCLPLLLDQRGELEALGHGLEGKLALFLVVILVLHTQRLIHADEAAEATQDEADPHEEEV